MSRQLPWLRVFVEGVVIVGSILLAFGIDAWWEGRQERALELEYAERLRADLVADTLRFSDVEGEFGIKVSVLRELLEARGIPPPVSDADQMMVRLNYSTWTAMERTLSTTFREMESSGTLGLLRDVTLRSNLGEYYAEYELLSDILAEPIGAYREILTGAFPGGLWYSSRVDSTQVDPDDVERGLRTLVSHPDLESAVNSELAYATSLIFYTRRFKADAKGLLAQLDEAYPE